MNNATATKQQGTRMGNNYYKGTLEVHLKITPKVLMGNDIT